MSARVGVDDLIAETGATAADLDALPRVEIQPELNAAALHGLPGRIVRAIDPYSEAAPVATLAHLLVAAGNLIGLVAVATLLGSVPGNGPYVTLEEDTFVRAFPGHLPANTTNTGGFCPDVIGCHAFVDFYMNGSVSGPKIVQDVSDTIPRLVRPPGGTFVALDLNQTDFGPGDTLRARLRVTNGAPTRTIDFYLGRLFPDGVTVFFITSLSPLAGVTVKTSEPEKFQPLVRNAEIQQGLDVTIVDALVVTLPPDFPEGESLLFGGITAAGTQTLVAPLATAAFTFSP